MPQNSPVNGTTIGSVDGSVCKSGRVTRRTGMRVGHGKVTSPLPLAPEKGRAPGASPPEMAYQRKAAASVEV